MKYLFDQYQLGDLTIKNRFALAPLTRCRSIGDYVPHELNAEYYRQRSTAGLIITEATNVSPNSNAFDKAPGIYTEEQAEGWKLVSEAVHKAGGVIFMQLWHSGRVSAESILNGKQPMAPSVTDGTEYLQVYASDPETGSSYPIKATLPREMSPEDIANTINEYKVAAKNAKEAGIDGVEIHAANGYLPHQFLSPGTNLRTDEYGGSVENRTRFLVEIIEVVSEYFPKNRIGVRFSPTALYNNVGDPNPEETYSYAAKKMEEAGIQYIHIADTNAWAGQPDMPELLKMVKPHFTKTIIVNAGIDAGHANTLIGTGQANIVAFGRTYIANPDLPERIKQGATLNQPDQSTFYGGSEKGYTDYPTLEEEAQVESL